MGATDGTLYQITRPTQAAQALSAVSSPRSHTIEVIQRYQLNHSHENAQYDEARTEDRLAAG
ncbi:hypothetical protein CFBP4215_02108 [Pseudomonas syringae pv. syringae]|nr:hypothetical protein CFBP4215_02108 [Pseudomonas syringae pv. syringae]